MGHDSQQEDENEGCVGLDLRFCPWAGGLPSGILRLMSTLQPSLNCSRPRCQQASPTWVSLLLTPSKYLTLTSTLSKSPILCQSILTLQLTTLSSRTSLLLRHNLLILTWKALAWS